MRGCFHFVRSVVWLISAMVLLEPQPVSAATTQAGGAVPAKSSIGPDAARAPLPDALGPEQWAQVEKAVDHALGWLAAQQQPDGSFPSAPAGQPAITSLAVLAFLSRGHQPGVGPYGTHMTRAIDFVLKCQQPDGLLTYAPVEATHVHLGASHTATYNHAIAGLMLTEVFGAVSGEQATRIKQCVEKALAVTRKMQQEPKTNPDDKGGWRYVRKYYGSASDSDLSVTAWHLMFLRSARNAEFDVPVEQVDAAMGYVERCFDERLGFVYGIQGSDHYTSRAMMGAGALSLALGGKHQTPMARKAGDWLLAHPFDEYGEDLGRIRRFHYSAYYCSQAMAQLGGRYWESFFPTLAKILLEHQAANGSWEPEQGEESIFGSAYTTALSVLALTPPYQLLPIYQR